MSGNQALLLLLSIMCWSGAGAFWGAGLAEAENEDDVASETVLDTDGDGLPDAEEDGTTTTE